MEPANAAPLRDPAYIRRKYGVPAKVGGRVRVYSGEEGTIVGHAPGQEHYLYVAIDGREIATPSILHPTWKVVYLDAE